MVIPANNRRIIVEIGDSQASTWSEDYESQRKEITETQCQDLENDGVVICPDDKHLWTTGRAISPRGVVHGHGHKYSAKPKLSRYECTREDCDAPVRMFETEDEWRDHEHQYTRTQDARRKMAGNTPWDSQLFPARTQGSDLTSMVTGDESYSVNLVKFDTEAFGQLLDSQESGRETHAGEEAAETAGGAEGGRQSITERGRQDDDETRTQATELVAGEGTGREVMTRVKEPQEEPRPVEEEPQNPPPRPQLQNRGPEEASEREPQAKGGVRETGSGAVGHPKSQEAGRNKRRREEAGTSGELQASKRRREDVEGGEPAEPNERHAHVVGAIAERLMAHLLDLASKHGVTTSMTVTADKVVLEVRLDNSRHGGKGGRDASYGAAKAKGEPARVT